MLQTDHRTLSRARRRLGDLRRMALAPRDRLTLSEWADRYARLPPRLSSKRQPLSPRLPLCPTQKCKPTPIRWSLR